MTPAVPPAQKDPQMIPRLVRGPGLIPALHSKLARASWEYSELKLEVSASSTVHGSTVPFDAEASSYNIEILIVTLYMLTKRV